jgi:type IV fimbrial biogenesis protein FimT
MRTAYFSVKGFGCFCRKKLPNVRGVTLVELMTTLAVLVISLALAAPALSSFLRSNRLRAAQSELVSSLMLARSEAARQANQVGVESLQPLADGGFARGWRVWVDANANGSFDNNEPVVREVPARGAPLTIAPTPAVRGVVFGPSGFVVANAAVSFVLCGQPGVANGYRVLLEPVGLADVSEVTTCP